MKVLVEGESKKSASEWQGRTDGNKTVIFPKGEASPGHYVTVSIRRANAATLFGVAEQAVPGPQGRREPDAAPSMIPPVEIAA